jgi:hypothetical protein
MALSDVVHGAERWFVAPCDCRFGMSCLPDNSVDCCVTDPPYGLSAEPDIAEVMRHWIKGEFYRHGSSGGFMGKAWDSFVPGPDYWRELYRVLKPGAYVFAFASSRTWDLMSIAIRFAGFENRDTIRHEKTGELLDGPPCLAWNYGSGFPKSLNVSKAIDEAAGAERRVIGTQTLTGSAALSIEEKGGTYASNTNSTGKTKEIQLTAPATDAAKQWDGYGTALKPAWEVILVFRKPLARTVAANVQEYSTGALNIDGCRVFTDWNEEDRPESWKASGRTSHPDADKIAAPPGDGIDCHPAGRWPPNVVFTHSEACERVGIVEMKRNIVNARGTVTPSQFGAMGGSRSIGMVNESVDAWRCAPGCPVAALDEQTGTLTSHGGDVRSEHTGLGFKGGAAGAARPVVASSGGASRFFPQFQTIGQETTAAPLVDAPFRYVAKASRAERDAGLDQFDPVSGGEATGRDDGAAGTKSPRAGAGRNGGARNTHPTVKAKDVIQWLVRLGCPPGGLVLDPFNGSGTTGIAVMTEGGGRRYVGLELDPMYVDMSRARIANVFGGKVEREWFPAPKPKEQPSLFDFAGGVK